MDQQKRPGEKEQPARGTSPSTKQIIKESIYQIEHLILVVGIKNEGLLHPVKEPTDRPSLSRNI